MEKHSKEPATLSLPALNGDQLFQVYTQHPSVKIVTAVCPFDITYTMADASMKNRREEDTVYLREEELQERLRRGNTLVLVND